MNYYKVEARFGKFGNLEFTFHIEAKNEKKALKIAKKLPGLTKNKKEAIKSVKQISYEEFLDYMNEIKLF